MNLNQIDIKNFILALFKRDDGERILLGSGAYEFDADLQHFAANIIANDVIEKQGTDGQLLAGQVRRSAPQSFDGYVGDATTTREDTENYRRAFIRFFQPRHFYTVIYILPDGSAIQRKNGYLADAPAVPEQYQRMPRYHVALAFEDLNYYSYAEDAQGEETYAQAVDLQPESELTGGLVWDAIGAEWEGESKRLTGINGNLAQTTYPGDNLLGPYSGLDTHYGVSSSVAPDGKLRLSGTANSTWFRITPNTIPLGKSIPIGLYTFTSDKAPSGFTFTLRLSTTGQSGYDEVIIQKDQKSATITTTAVRDRIYIFGGSVVGHPNVGGDYGLMFGTNLTPDNFEPYTGAEPSPSPDYPQPILTVSGSQTITIDGTNYPLDLGTIELCKINNTKDYIYKSGADWKLHTAIAGRTFNGSDTDINASGWFNSSETTTTLQVAALNIATLNANFAGHSYSKMTHFEYLTDNATMSNGKFKMVNNLSGSVNHIRLALSKTIAADITAAQNWMATNKPRIYYALKTATDTTITDATLIAQLEAISTALDSGDTPIITAGANNLPAILMTESTHKGGAVWDAETGHATTTFTVNGLYAVNPIWTVPGPAESPLIENTTNGTSLSYLGQIPAGQSLIIDCGNQTATIAGANVKNNVRGTWQTFEPGQITIRYSGANITGPSNLKWNEVVG